MDDRYDAFCAADPTFYDAVGSGAAGRPTYPAAGRALPDGWQRRAQGDWLAIGPPEVELPPQGWKIHAAACLDNAERILDAVWEYCVPRRIGFKFLRSPAMLLARVSKYAPRGYSGKFVTIYPVDEHAGETILHELGERLDGEPSPYILSDLRWENGPLYVRYGAFAGRYCAGPDGQLVPAVADGSGALVPDRRDPVFHVPSWVTLPEFLVPQLARRNGVTVDDLPYTIEGVLHFSNGGGVYAARDTRTGARVVLKEGRPHAGLDGRGQDAVTRIEREYDVLQRLAGVDGVPRVHDLFWLGEHRFMAMEFVAGTPLSQAIAARHPLSNPAAGPADLAGYTEWAVLVFGRVEAIVQAVHRRGLTHGDLHLFNIMVSDDATVTLIDFEVAFPRTGPGRPPLGNQGFAPPADAVGTDVDRYALACLRLALFLPMTQLLWLSREKARHFAAIIAEEFPVAKPFLAPAVRAIVAPRTPNRADPRVEADPAQWPRLRAELARSIVDSATPDRDDRLFPGDIQQFAEGGLGIAWGAAGVLYALSVTGAGRYPEFEQWLLARAANPPAGTRLGLYDGLHGVAFVLEHLGHRQAALDLVEACLAQRWPALGLDLRGGLAGIGLNLFHLADRTGESELRVVARRAAEWVAERLGDVSSVPTTSGGTAPPAGLMRGSAGAARLLLRAYDDSGDPRFLVKAATALRQDLRRCVTRRTGAMEVDEGWRTMPYLDAGSIGIGLVLDDYLTRCPDEDFAAASEAIALAARSPMCVQPGLFSGRAGMVLYLAGRSAAPATDPLVVAQVRRLAWHAVRHGDGLAFPGSALLRLSMDLGTGTAGVLLALGAVLHDRPVPAPLLSPSRPAPVPEFPRQPSRAPITQP